MPTGAGDTALRAILRFIGTPSLFAVIFVAAPEAWMVAIHDALDMGQLPDAPVVGYLARSTSAFYAMLGGLFWVVSFDLARHRTVLIYLGWTVALFGAVLLAVDWFEGMPPSWTLWEGPFVCLLGVAMLWLSVRVETHTDTEKT